MKNFSPPNWAPFAVPTDKGWVNPNTGELLISYRGLKTQIDKQKKPEVSVEIRSTKNI